MKCKILVFNKIGDPDKGLRIADREEWTAILERNRELPAESRRYFIKDVIDDGKGQDILFIETGKEKYDQWHREEVLKRRSRGDQKRYQVISGDTWYPERDESLFDLLESPENTEEEALNLVLMEQFLEEISGWKVWAPELFDLYQDGRQKEAVRILSVKYRVSSQTVRKWKRDFEEKVKLFFEKDLNWSATELLFQTIRENRKKRFLPRR